MRAVIQRVSKASVTLSSAADADKKAPKATIGAGFLILLGVAGDDTPDDAEWLARKVMNLRVFDDEAGVMNRSISQLGGNADKTGDILVISQFTLFASYKKNNRPSWMRAAPREISVPLYEYFLRLLTDALGHPAACGEFGAEMQVTLVNDGPVTICIDTKNKE